MKKNKYFLLSVFVILFSACGSADKSPAVSSENVLANDSGKQTEIADSVVAEKNNTSPENVSPPVETKGNVHRSDSLKQTKFEIKIFRNTDISGFGYDILLENGRPYIHQPNIPALPGNNGFSSEEVAKKVAALVVFKIRNNIIPPTVDVRELDSLGVR
jgi:hypothetical protein